MTFVDPEKRANIQMTSFFLGSKIFHEQFALVKEFCRTGCYFRNVRKKTNKS